jgi:hypothetical protein
MPETTELRAEDVTGVRSRVAWGAIFAGLFVALAVSVLLSILGTALGLTAADTTRSDYVATGAAIWAALTGLIALFLGGWVTTQCTAGENKMEAVLYGVILWGLMFAAVAWISFNSVRLTFAAALGTANVAANADLAARSADWEQTLRDRGFTQEQINQVRASVPTLADVQNAANDPEVRRRAMQTAWWSLFGTVISMIASIGGALAGSGPTPWLRGVFVRRTTVTTTGPGTPLR